MALGLISLELNAGSITNLSMDKLGNSGNGSSINAAISANGRFVVYHSRAGNPVANDTNNASDIYYFDKKNKTTDRLTEGNNDSVDARISGNGRYVVYSSAANNLVQDDTNARNDIFLFDSKKSTHALVSVNRFGQPGNGGSFLPSISANGRFIIYESLANNLFPKDRNQSRDIFLYDTSTGLTRLVSVTQSNIQGNGSSYKPSVSNNGRYAAFSSDASNFAANDTNNASDVFLYDVKTRIITLVSVNAEGMPGNGRSFDAQISGNGRFVVYLSNAGNLVEGDTNDQYDIFLYDRKKNTTRRISINSLGEQANGSSLSPRISTKGRFIAYVSDADNLVDNDNNQLPDIFRFDNKTGITSRISLNAKGGEATGAGSFSPDINANGRYVVFESYADDLVEGDTNGNSDIFLSDTKN
jgi:Tol biopolymer transport system component